MSLLNFGTSGVRGLASDFTEVECHAFVSGFAQLFAGFDYEQVLVAGDLRESTPVIKAHVIRSLQSLGYRVLDGGLVPTPALAWSCKLLNLPGVMITGSHIPADRNGLKFYLPEGEILKAHEAKILDFYRNPSAQAPAISEVRVNPEAMECVDMGTPFLERYGRAFPGKPLRELRIGFYSHSSVARDLYPAILSKLGAEVHEFGRSDVFIPVDTEAVDRVQFMHDVLKEKQLHLVVSTDGDADRPLVISDSGKVIPGEILGLITSSFLAIEMAIYPVSCSSAVEKSNRIPECIQTKIGSPFVLEQILEQKAKNPSKKIAGFEANGGYLLATRAQGLDPLMTRDSLLPILAFLLSMKANATVSPDEILLPFKPWTNVSGLIKDFSPDKSSKVLRQFKSMSALGSTFSDVPNLGIVLARNELDGVRVQFQKGIVHLRPSGNAPEFRIYIESGDESEAQSTLASFKTWVIEAGKSPEKP